MNVEYIEIIKGGHGSGFYGHAGRPGRRGGSAPRGGSGASVGEQGAEGAQGREGRGKDAPRGQLTVDADERSAKLAKMVRLISEGVSSIHKPKETVYRREALDAFQEVMINAAKWVAKMADEVTVDAELERLPRETLRIATINELLYGLTRRWSKVHEPRSRDLHVVPGPDRLERIQLSRRGVSGQVYALEDANGKRAVYKLAIGEAEDAREGMALGLGAVREVTISRIADILGLTGDAEGATGWRVVRSDFIGDGVEGSVTEWVDASDEVLMIDRIDPQVMREVAIFDMLIGNTDRHVGNLMIDTDGKLVAIDHDLTYGNPFSPGANRITWSEARRKSNVEQAGGGEGWRIGEHERKLARRLLEHRDEVEQIAKETDIAVRAIEGMMRRAQIVMEVDTWDELEDRLRADFRGGRKRLVVD